MIKYALIILLLLGRSLGAAETNTFYYTDFDVSALFTNEQMLPKYQMEKREEEPEPGRLYRTEIVYGSFENLDANIVMSREAKGIGYLITYNRFKINSYTTNNTKLFNSAYGYDAFSAGVNLNLLEDLSLNFTVDYNYRYNGMLFNTNYNNQFKRLILISPQLKYFLNEKSFFHFNFLYSNLNLEYESFKRNLFNKYYYFNTEINYKRIWSTINSFQFRFLNVQDSLQNDQVKRNNNYARFQFQDKFALSRMLLWNTGLAFDVNKRYAFILSPMVSLSLLFPSFNILLGYERFYDINYSSQFITENNFFKYPADLLPRINDRIALTLFLHPVKPLTWTATLSYEHNRNYPQFKFDTDDLAYSFNLKEMNLVRLSQELAFKTGQTLGLYLSYQYIPFSQPEKVYQAYRNELKFTTEVDASPVSMNLVLHYYDINYFLDKTNNYIIMEPNVLVDLVVKATITQSFGIVLKVKNLSFRRIFSIPLYPSMENIVNVGISAGF